jgi:hypothetical protein
MCAPGTRKRVTTWASIDLLGDGSFFDQEFPVLKIDNSART